MKKSRPTRSIIAGARLYTLLEMPIYQGKSTSLTGRSITRTIALETSPTDNKNFLSELFYVPVESAKSKNGVSIGPGLIVVT